MSVLPFITLPPKQFTDDAAQYRKPIDIEDFQESFRASIDFQNMHESYVDNNEYDNNDEEDEGGNDKEKIKRTSVPSISILSMDHDEEDEDGNHDINNSHVEDDEQDNFSKKMKAIKYKREHKLYEDDEQNKGFFSSILHYIQKKRIEYRDQRLHYLVQDYKKKIILYEEMYKQQIINEMKEQDQLLQQEVNRLALKQHRIQKEKERKARGNKYLENELARRKKEAKKLDCLCHTMQNWYIENHERKQIENQKFEEQQRYQEYKRQETIRITHELAISNADALELHTDKQTSAWILEMMRKSGDIVPGKVLPKKTENQTKLNISILKEVKVKLLPEIKEQRLQNKLSKAKKERVSISYQNAFDIDLSLVKQAIKVTGYDLGIEGALSLGAELSTGACPRMQILDISRCNLTNKGLGCLLRGIKTGNLLYLDTLILRGNGIGEQGMIYLKEALNAYALETLKKLDLRENELHDTGVSILAHAILKGTLRNIQEIYLQRNNITDVGFTKIISVIISVKETICPLLQSLCINENRVSGACKQSFQPYPSYLTV